MSTVFEKRDLQFSFLSRLAGHRNLHASAPPFAQPALVGRTMQLPSLGVYLGESAAGEEDDNVVEARFGGQLPGQLRDDVHAGEFRDSDRVGR